MKIIEERGPTIDNAGSKIDDPGARNERFNDRVSGNETIEDRGPRNDRVERI